MICRSGFLTIYDTIREDIIKIDMAEVSQILTNKKKTILELRIDNDEIVRLEL